MKYILTPILLAIAPMINLQAQTTLEEKTLNLPSDNEETFEIVTTIDGGYVTLSEIILTNPAEQTVLTKFDQNLDTVFTTIIKDSLLGMGQNREVLTADGGYLVMSDHSDILPQPNYDIEIRKYNVNGGIELFETFDFAELNIDGNTISEFLIRDDPNGGFIVAVGNSNLNPPASITLIKLNSTLDTVWTKKYITPDLISDVFDVRTTGNGYLVAISLYTNQLVYPAVLTTNSSGDSLWLKQINTQSTTIYGYKAKEATNGEIVVIGDINNGDFDYYIAKLDANGNIMFETDLGDNDEQGVLNFVQSADGGFLIVGYYENSNDDLYDYTTKVDAAGNFVWDATFLSDQQSYWSYLSDLVNTNDGNFVAVGSRFDQATDDSEMYLVKFNDGTTGIADADALAPIKVFPTLANSLGDIKVKLPANETFTLEVFDLQGQLLWSQEQATGTVMLNAGKVTPGQYLIRATSTSIRFTHKVVVQ